MWRMFYRADQDAIMNNEYLREMQQMWWMFYRADQDAFFPTGDEDELRPTHDLVLYKETTLLCNPSTIPSHAF